MARSSVNITDYFSVSYYPLIALCLSLFVTFAVVETDDVFSASHTATVSASAAKDLRWVNTLRLMLASVANTHYILYLSNAASKLRIRSEK